MAATPEDTDQICRASAAGPPMRNRQRWAAIQRSRVRSADDDKCTGRKWTLQAHEHEGIVSMVRPIQHPTYCQRTFRTPVKEVRINGEHWWCCWLPRCSNQHLEVRRCEPQQTRRMLAHCACLDGEPEPGTDSRFQRENGPQEPGGHIHGSESPWER